MDLHYSQTNEAVHSPFYKFHYLMDLHYSQTTTALARPQPGFTTLWIYTILKLNPSLYISAPVSLPYGFTLFSNTQADLRRRGSVSLPYGFTLFSNEAQDYKLWVEFHYLMDLHYSQTAQIICFRQLGFTTLWIYTILKP